MKFIYSSGKRVLDGYTIDQPPDDGNGDGPPPQARRLRRQRLPEGKGELLVVKEVREEADEGLEEHRDVGAQRADDDRHRRQPNEFQTCRKIALLSAAAHRQSSCPLPRSPRVTSGLVATIQTS